MTVATANRAARRKLRFESLDEVVADAERLVASPDTKMLGTWPLGQLLAHLAMGVKYSIDGGDAKAPLAVRLLGPLIKGRILKRGMPAGFKMPKEKEIEFFPPTSCAQEGLDKLRAAIDRARNERMTARHPVFGALSDDQWRRLHLRHAELHLSFALPGAA